MSVTLTSEQIMALAPDTASAKAGKGLANARKWVLLGCNENSAWGACQGSAKLPYQAQIELSEPAFHCTCPSRKFPCKHTLGLFLLLESEPKAFSNTDMPEWVTKWLEGRVQKAEKKAKKQEHVGEVVDIIAQAKRLVSRQKKVEAGLGELEIWLGDLIRNGLAAVQAKPPSFWETQATRMVDAQAKGVEQLLRKMSGITASGDDWQERLLEKLGRLHLLIEGYNHLDSLPLPTQADVRALVGFAPSQNELLTSGASIHDQWLVLGQIVEDIDKLRVQRIWLQAEKSHQTALVIFFNPVNTPLDTSFIVGTKLDAELVFYPSNYPLRALVKYRHAAPIAMNSNTGYETILLATQAYADALSRNPWLEQLGMWLQKVWPIKRGDSWFLRDKNNYILPIAANFSLNWELLALSGGQPIGIFGEWNGDYFWPLSAGDTQLTMLKGS